MENWNWVIFILIFFCITLSLLSPQSFDFQREIGATLYCVVESNLGHSGLMQINQQPWSNTDFLSLKQVLLLWLQVEIVSFGNAKTLVSSARKLLSVNSFFSLNLPGFEMCENVNF